MRPVLLVLAHTRVSQMQVPFASRSRSLRIKHSHVARTTRLEEATFARRRLWFAPLGPEHGTGVVARSAALWCNALDAARLLWHFRPKFLNG